MVDTPLSLASIIDFISQFSMFHFLTFQAGKPEDRKPGLRAGEQPSLHHSFGKWDLPFVAIFVPLA
jgi:hypothetical protein